MAKIIPFPKPCLRSWSIKRLDSGQWRGFLLAPEWGATHTESGPYSLVLQTVTAWIARNAPGLPLVTIEPVARSAAI